MDKIIEINHLNKSFGKIKAVDDLSFYVEEGELFAFLGINGAGKSTTISIMCGQLEKDSGQIIIDGYDIDKISNVSLIKKEIGIVFQDSVLDKSLTVYDNLESRAALYGIYKEKFIEQLKKVSKILNFENLLDRPYGKLSGGQKRRIDIARAIIHNPKILILDEPTTGLDPRTRTLVWNAIESLRKELKMTVFLTTHYMEEASDADYVVIIDEGKKVASGTPLDLKNKYTGDFITLYNICEDDIKQMHLSYQKINDYYQILVSNTKEAVHLIHKYPDLFVDFEITKGKMDDVFLAATGKVLTGGDCL